MITTKRLYPILVLFFRYQLMMASVEMGNAATFRNRAKEKALLPYLWQAKPLKTIGAPYCVSVCVIAMGTAKTRLPIVAARASVC